MVDSTAKVAGVGGAAVPEKEEADKKELLELKIHEIAQGCQNQNGLRHGDYHQYRQYCTRRLKRIRSSRGVRFMFGKGKSFVRKVRTVLKYQSNPWMCDRGHPPHVGPSCMAS